jgi:hypothetical protein
MGHCDEVSHHVCPSYSSTRIYHGRGSIRSHLRPARSDGHRFLMESTEKQNEQEVRARMSFQLSAQGPGSQLDLYCRVGACLASLKHPSVCMKHRAGHFPLAWRCPGPCQTRSANRGVCSRAMRLKRHLLFPRNASCKDAVLRLLGLESIPASGRGTAWMTTLSAQRCSAQLSSAPLVQSSRARDERARAAGILRSGVEPSRGSTCNCQAHCARPLILTPLSQHCISISLPSFISFSSCP